MKKLKIKTLGDKDMENDNNGQLLENEVRETPFIFGELVGETS